jgi:uncharacterized membrane protein YkgB
MFVERATVLPVVFNELNFNILEAITKKLSEYIQSLEFLLVDNDNLVIVGEFANKKIPEFILDLKNSPFLLENNYFSEFLNKELVGFERKINLAFDLIYHQSDEEFLKELVGVIKDFSYIAKDVSILKASTAYISGLIEPQVTKALEDVKKKVSKIDAALLAIEQNETDKIYLNLYNKYNKEYVFNNMFFYISIFVGVFFTYYSTIELTDITNPTVANYQSYQNFWIKFITIKFLILSATVTFATLFLRRLSHAKKLKEQAYQTHVEISAFPIHVRSLKEEDKHELVKELTMKYFGKELDQTQNDKIGDLIQDQLAAGTELIKASAELVKSVKPTSSSVVQE